MSGQISHCDAWQDCDDCGGSGLDETMCECERIEDICCCAVPTPVACEMCRGRGGWPLDLSAEEQDADANDRDL